MSLRARLIIVFFLLSVVPLAAVTFYSYTSNVRAVRDAATRESDLLAGELTQRMQLVTAELGERVEHLLALENESQTAATTGAQMAEHKPAAASSSVSSKPAAAASTKPHPTSSSAARAESTATPPTASAGVPPGTSALEETYGENVAQALGEAAMLLNNVELRGMGRSAYAHSGHPPPRAGGEGAGAQGAPLPGPPGLTTVPPPPPPAVAAPPAPTGGAPTTAPVTPSGEQGSRGNITRGQGPRVHAGGRPNATPTAGASDGGAGSPTSPAGRGEAAPVGAAGAGASGIGASPAGTGPPNATGGAASGDESARLMIDLAPIRRDILRQIVPDGQLENLTPDERQRVARELNQRMLGIAQGIQLGAAGLQKRAADAEREAAAAQAKAAVGKADTKAETSAKAVESTPKPATHTTTIAPHAPPVSESVKKTAALSGSHLGVMVEQNGQMVEQISAEINMPQVLATVFSSTRRDRGEVPFAIGKDGKLYTQTDADRKTIESLKLPAPPEGQATTTITHGDWIIVTTADPSGSGLRFGVAKPVGDLLSDIRRTTARNTSFGLGFIALALVGIVPLSGRLTRNLTKLTDGVDRIAHGDYSARVPLKTNDEIGRLATAFNRMAGDVEQHQRAAVEQERVKRELELGRQIQHEMLPQAPLRLGLTEIRGVSVPAREVGGDFFNYFELADHRVALLVGDVSGKGVGAALLMANIQASLRTRLALGQELSEIADAIDRDVDANSPGPVYATLFVAILDPPTRRLRYVNAGHNPQYALCHGGLVRMESTGLPVGLLSGRGYTAMELQLAAGDLLFFYTDGCVEAMNVAGEWFGAARLEAILTDQLATSTSSSDGVLQRVEAAVKAFRAGAEPSDDETMMAVKVG